MVRDAEPWMMVAAPVGAWTSTTGASASTGTRTVRVALSSPSVARTVTTTDPVWRALVPWSMRVPAFPKSPIRSVCEPTAAGPLTFTRIGR